MTIKRLSKLPTIQEFLRSQRVNENSQEGLGDTFCIRLHNGASIQYWTGTRFETYESDKAILSEASAVEELKKAEKVCRDIGCSTMPYIAPITPKSMTEKMQPKKNQAKTRFEQMTMKQAMALPDDELEEIWNEYIEALKARGDYNPNAEKDFFTLLDKACTKKSR